MSRLEARSDVLISTLRTYVEALGSQAHAPGRVPGPGAGCAQLPTQPRSGAQEPGIEQGQELFCALSGLSSIRQERRGRAAERRGGAYNEDRSRT